LSCFTEVFQVIRDDLGKTIGTFQEYVERGQTGALGYLFTFG
jgi:hypothetical protein